MEKTEENKSNKKNKTIKLVLNILFWTVIGFFGVLFLLTGIDKISGYKVPIFGYRQSVVVSESMQHAYPGNDYLDDTMTRINKYDVIVTKNYKSYEEIQKYDVVTHLTEQGLICHRVVDLYEQDGVKYIVTRGDANATNDTPFAYSLIRGKVVNVIPNVGRTVLFIQSPYFMLALFGSCFFVFLGMYIYTRGKEKKAIPENGEANEPQNENPRPVQEEKPEETPKEEPVPESAPNEPEKLEQDENKDNQDEKQE